MVIGSYRWLQIVIEGDNNLMVIDGYRVLLMVICDKRGLQGVRDGFKWLQRVIDS